MVDALLLELGPRVAIGIDLECDELTDQRYIAIFCRGMEALGWRLETFEDLLDQRERGRAPWTIRRPD